MDMSAAEMKRAASAQPQTNPPAEPNGSEILVKCLQAEGVKFLWGYPGGAVLYIYDALYKQETIEHVLVRHEQAAVHAADGYARATGEVGVALVTSGPGVTNAVTGIATAYMDSIPMVIITGQVPTPAIGLDAFQECDTVGITRPIVKHNFLVKDVLQELIAQIREAHAKPDVQVLSAWWGQINEWRKRDCLKFKNSTEVIKPQFVVDKLWELTKDRDTYITSDVGQHQMWAAQYYRFEQPRRWINSGGLGTMGVGLPYAMGIKLAKPDSDVFCITGEGSIQMCIQELSTCLQYKTPVKIVSLNNRYLGMVRQWQELDYGGRYSHSYMDALPDFVKLAEAYGHVGLKIEKPSDVEPALREAIKLKDRTVFLDVRTDPTENVWPMVQAGKGISEMLLGSEDL